jgi:hypothetical protein
VVFLIESLVGGFAFTVFFSYMAYGFSTRHMPLDLQALFGGTFGRLFAVVIVLHLLLHAGRAITGLWSNAQGLQAWQHAVDQPLFHLGLWGGIVLPLILTVAASLRQSHFAQVLAAVLVMVGLFIVRYEFIIGGQLVPLFLNGAAAAVREAAAGLDGPEALLRLYAGLFLTPPAPVHLTAAVLGNAAFEIEQWYARHGFIRCAGFHDLADHVTAQLEFVRRPSWIGAELWLAVGVDVLDYAVP